MENEAILVEDIWDGVCFSGVNSRGNRFNNYIQLMKNIIYILLISCLVFGCRSKKAVTEKESESITTITHNDIKKTEVEIETSSRAVKAASKDFSIKSIDPAKPSYYYKKGDTTHFQNADVKFTTKKREAKEDTKKEIKKAEEDNSTTETDSAKSKKNRNVDITSASWGVNLAIIAGIILLIVIGYVHLRTRKP